MTRINLALSHPKTPAPLPNLAQVHSRLELFLNAHSLDAVFVSAQDAFLSEYTSLSNNQRYALTQFSGSTGDGIFVSRALADGLNIQGQFLLFVDGRYHLQADEQCSPKHVTVVKLSMSMSIESALVEWLTSVNLMTGKIGFDGARTTLKRANAFAAMAQTRNFKLHNFIANEISAALELTGWTSERAIRQLPESATGRSIQKNLKALHSRLPAGVTPANSCLVTCATDDVAWLLNARGYHLPHQSSFMAYSFTVGKNITLFLPDDSSKCPVDIPESNTAEDGYQLTVVRGNLALLQSHLSALKDVAHLLYDNRVMNAALPTLVQTVWPHAKVHSDFDAIEVVRAQKTPQELEAFRSSFLKSSKAIAETLRWVKSSCTLPAGVQTSDPDFKAPVSEMDLSSKISKEYGKQGALELSFNSIAGSGPHGAIIHYGTPDENTPLAPGDLVLLDSGAYYDEGIATDCTRVAFAAPYGTRTPEPWQTEIYTVTLKATIKGMMSEFAKTERGVNIDAAIRNIVREKGYEYNHGTGHGVGIHVHESGIRLSTTSTYGFAEHAVCSIEPGIYLAGKGGVRIENVAAVTQHPLEADKFVFENFAFVGFDWDLIDVEILTGPEKEYLKNYEAHCATLGTTLTPCPL